MKDKHIKEEDFLFYLTGDLEPDIISGIEKHLHNCRSCRERLMQERMLYSHILKSSRPVPTRKKLESIRKRFFEKVRLVAREQGYMFSSRKAIEAFLTNNFAMKLGEAISELAWALSHYLAGCVSHGC